LTKPNSVRPPNQVGVGIGQPDTARQSGQKMHLFGLPFNGADTTTSNNVTRQAHALEILSFYHRNKLAAPGPSLFLTLGKSKRRM
jgi:hypothetical protein